MEFEESPDAEESAEFSEGSQIHINFDANDLRQFRQLMGRVRAGSQEAAWELLGSYGAHVLKVVRKMLGQSLRSKFDSQDFTQAVWKSFFLSRRQVMEFDRPEHLIAFLAGMARHKVIDEVRKREGSLKADVRRERSLDQLGEDCVGAPVRRQPTPSEFAIAHEQWDRLISNQPPRDRQIVELRYAGESYDEIASRLNVNEKTVRRVLDRLFQKVNE